MKLKLKFCDGRPNCQLHLDDAKIKNYGQLRGEVSAVMNASVAFDLSLNYGKDLLRTDDETTLQELGLVTGDVLMVVIPRNVSAVPDQVPGSLTVKNITDVKKENLLDQKNVKNASDYIYRITLCRESEPGAIPSALECLYLSQPVESKFDALVLAIHILMCEVGFVLDKVDNSIPLLASWRKVLSDKSIFYKMEYRYPVCPFDSCQVVCMSERGNKMILHGLISGASKDEIINIHLQCDDYLHNFPIYKCDPKHLFCQLPRLSQYFKDDFALPLLNIIRIDAGIPSKSDFMSLPVELKRMIFNYLNCWSLTRLSIVCSELNQICSDNMLWKKCCTRDFPKYTQTSDDQPGSDWKMRYVEICKKERDEKKKFQALHMALKRARFQTYQDSRLFLNPGLAERQQIDRTRWLERRRLLEGIIPVGVGFPYH